MIPDIPLGLSVENCWVVEAGHTPLNWHSGVGEVLATPQMIGWMEATAVDVVDHLLPDGYRSVGTKLDVRHLAATPVGARVTVRATLLDCDGKHLTFHVEAFDSVGLIGEGQHQRYVIHLQRFQARAKARLAIEGVR
ncbi:MAG: thioesterase family protein [Anaerolineae bacterium]